MGHSPWSRKESDTTEQLSVHTHIQVYMENSEGTSPVLPAFGCMAFHCMDKPEFI